MITRHLVSFFAVVNVIFFSYGAYIFIDNIGMLLICVANFAKLTCWIYLSVDSLKFSW